MKYQGWEYSYKDGKFNLNCPDEIERPESFYKYYALTPNSVNALTNMYLYATHPNQFSDLYDCNTSLLDFENTDESILEALYYPLYGDFLKAYGNIDSLRKYTSENYKTLLYRHLGLVSLTDCGDYSTLWNYYAQNSGFCIEFDTKQFFFQHHGPFPVQYVEKLTPVKVEGNLQEATFIQTNVKLNTFKVENEWRLLVSNSEGFDFKIYDEFGEEDKKYNIGNLHDRKVIYPLSAIKSITLGERFLLNKDIRIVSVSPYEKEIWLLKEADELYSKILDFLSEMNIKTYVRCLGDSNVPFVYNQIGIKKLNSQRYSIIYIYGNKNSNKI